MRPEWTLEMNLFMIVLETTDSDGKEADIVCKVEWYVLRVVWGVVLG